MTDSIKQSCVRHYERLGSCMKAATNSRNGGLSNIVQTLCSIKNVLGSIQESHVGFDPLSRKITRLGITM